MSERAKIRAIGRVVRPEKVLAAHPVTRRQIMVLTGKAIYTAFEAGYAAAQGDTVKREVKWKQSDALKTEIRKRLCRLEVTP